MHANLHAKKSNPTFLVGGPAPTQYLLSGFVFNYLFSVWRGAGDTSKIMALCVGCSQGIAQEGSPQKGVSGFVKGNGGGGTGESGKFDNYPEIPKPQGMTFLNYEQFATKIPKFARASHP